MQIAGQIIFVVLLGIATFFFVKSIKTIRRNIFLGKPFTPDSSPKFRWKNMGRVALGQSKMVKRPIAGFFHILIYIGFVLINIEVLEIIIDGIFGTHRLFQAPLGGLYNTALAFFEILGVLVIIACIVFLIRRDAIKLRRLNMPEMKGWPKLDGRLILIIELVLMVALFTMNAADRAFQASSSMPISSWIAPLFDGFSDTSLHIIERSAWWIHIVGILIFLNYVPYSKHLHIFLAFPNTYYARQKPSGVIENNPAITTEVNLMMDPAATPPEGYEAPTSFGVKDVTDLTWKNLLDAYTCTECGRCTSVCPANQTGKLLSPRKVMMDTRDRLEEHGKHKDSKAEDTADAKTLHDYISAEELWACTTCNACTEACPGEINPVEIIVGMRQYKVMEEAIAPTEINNMLSNLENNGAPWQFSAMDRDKWTKE
jgi:heterodisulfide reductase subunit C/nitrate reductase gamma subunit